MKKTAIVAVLAVALVLVFAATAMARPNGNIYIQWTSAAPNDLVQTPHRGYTTGTEKCNVCHSVHYAATANFAWPDGTQGPNAWTADNTDTQMLLRSSVAYACNYCHIETAIGGIQLYGGVVTNYTTGSGFSHNAGSPSSTAWCSNCHSVHGANTFQGANVNKILRYHGATSTRPIQPEVVGAAGANASITPVFANDAAALASADKYTQQIAFCTQCHAEYSDASEHTITGGPGYYNDPDGSGPASGGYIAGSEYKGHPLKSADTTFVAAGDTVSTRVAWKGSDTCRACHDAGETNSAPGVNFNSFPHYTYGYYVFSFTGGDNSSVDASNAAKEYATDGNCLKCHNTSNATEGVNKNF